MNAAQLQEALAEYYLQQLRWRDFIRVFLPLVLVVLAPLGYGFWRTLYGYSSFGPAAAAKWGRPWFLVSGILVIPLLFYSLHRLRRAHTWIKVYPHGIHYHQPLRRKKTLSWDDIHGLTTYSVQKSFLELFKNTKNHLILYSDKYAPYHPHPGLTGQAGLKKIIKEQVYTRLKPKIIPAFKNGQTISFGRLSISREKLFLPDREVPWESLEGISVQEGTFRIKGTTWNSITIPIRDLINLEILILLIKTEI